MMEECKICNDECTPWFYIHGHICEMCYMKAKQNCYCEGDTWIDIKEKLPEKDGRYIVCVEYSPQWIGISSLRNGVWDDSLITHWQPLPEPLNGVIE